MVEQLRFFSFYHVKQDNRPTETIDFVDRIE